MTSAPFATAGNPGHFFQSSSQGGRTPPAAPATMTSGLAANTASTLTTGAGSVSAANTFSPPQAAIACETRWRPPSVKSGASQIS